MFFLILVAGFLCLLDLGLPLLAFVDVPLASQQAIRVVLLAFVHQVGFLLDIDVHELQGVLDEAVLNLVVEGSVGGEAGSMVDFDDVGFPFVVDHDVESQHVEAHGAGVVLRLGELVLVAHEGQPRDDGLDDDCLYFLLESRQIRAPVCHLLEHCAEGSLVPYAHVLVTRVEDKVAVMLVDRIVRQMHAESIKVGIHGLVVKLCCKSCQPLVVHVETQGVGTRQQHIDPQVELETINQVGPGQIALDHIVLAGFHVLDFTG